MALRQLDPKFPQSPTKHNKRGAHMTRMKSIHTATEILPLLQ